MKVKLSVLMITKNAGKLVGQSLESIKSLASEIIIVDGGSSDNTLKIVKKYQAKIFPYRGEDWGHQCQIGLEKVTGDWVLVLDSDEVVTKKLALEIEDKLKHSKSKVYGYFIPFQNHYLGRAINYGGENYKKMILFKKKFGHVEQTLVHYYYQVNEGKTDYLKNKIFHYSYLSITQVFSKFTDYGMRMAKKKYYAGEKSSFKKIFLYPIHMFYARFIEDKGYMDGFFRIPLDLGFAYMEWLIYIRLFLMTL